MRPANICSWEDIYYYCHSGQFTSLLTFVLRYSSWKPTIYPRVKGAPGSSSKPPRKGRMMRKKRRLARRDKSFWVLCDKRLGKYFGTKGHTWIFQGYCYNFPGEIGRRRFELKFLRKYFSGPFFKVSTFISGILVAARQINSDAKNGNRNGQCFWPRATTSYHSDNLLARWYRYRQAQSLSSRNVTARWSL